jgi:hypothetical protein
MVRQIILAEFHRLAGKYKPHKSNLWQEYGKTDNPGRVPSSCWQGLITKVKPLTRIWKGRYVLLYARKTHNRRFLKVFREASNFWRSGQMGGQKSLSPLKNPQKLPITDAQFPETA